MATPENLRDSVVSTRPSTIFWSVGKVETALVNAGFLNLATTSHTPAIEQKPTPDLNNNATKTTAAKAELAEANIYVDPTVESEVYDPEQRLQRLEQALRLVDNAHQEQPSQPEDLPNAA